MSQRTKWGCNTSISTWTFMVTLKGWGINIWPVTQPLHSMLPLITSNHAPSLLPLLLSLPHLTHTRRGELWPQSAWLHLSIPYQPRTKNSVKNVVLCFRLSREQLCTRGGSGRGRWQRRRAFWTIILGWSCSHTYTHPSTQKCFQTHTHRQWVDWVCRLDHRADSSPVYCPAILKMYTVIWAGVWMLESIQYYLCSVNINSNCFKRLSRRRWQGKIPF